MRNIFIASIIFFVGGLILASATNPEGKAWLEENSKNEGVVTLASGLQVSQIPFDRRWLIFFFLFSISLTHSLNLLVISVQSIEKRRRRISSDCFIAMHMPLSRNLDRRHRVRFELRPARQHKTPAGRHNARRARRCVLLALFHSFSTLH